MTDRIAEIMPPDLEAKAARMYEQMSLDESKEIWLWTNASLHTKNRWRIKILVEDRNQWRKNVST